MTTSKKSDLELPVSPRDHARGSRDAAVTLLEYGDFDCPYCKQAYPGVRALLQHFGADLRFVFRHNPRGELHPYARVAAQASEAAAIQGQFWQMHDRLFLRQGPLDQAALTADATALGLNLARFQTDLRAPGVVARIRKDEEGGLRSGVVGTPTFFIDGLHFRDKPDFETLEHAIEARLVHESKPARRSPIRRRDGSGHLDPEYRAKLLQETGSSHEPSDDHAFFAGAHSHDAFAEQLGEQFMETATSGQDEGQEVFNQTVPEDGGGPFVETSGNTEFASGTDASNITGATREPFPKT